MVKKTWLDRHLPLINKLLLLVIVAINLYVIGSPFFPQVSYKVKQATTKQVDLGDKDQRKAIDKSYDHLIIPKIFLDEKIWIGDNEKLVNKGIWQVPHTSTPDKGSNTVLVGHRFTYKDAAVLYHLDKIDEGDLISVVWKGELYNYRVTEKKIVQPTDVYVEDPTEDEVLTIYTCHPIWSIKERLVVVSKLEGIE